MKPAFALLMLPCLSFAASFNDNSYAAIAKRLEPVGIVDILGQAKIIEQKIIDAAVPDRSGKEIYDQYCVTCHSIGAAGSPKFGCAHDWTPRKAKGMTLLLQHALSGFNFMPAHGTCMDCKDAEIEEAIHYMINHSSSDDTACNKNA